MAVKFYDDLKKCPLCGGNVELYKVRGDTSSKIDLCDNCRISFRKWYEGEQLDDIQEQDEQTRPEEDTSAEE